MLRDEPLIHESLTRVNAAWGELWINTLEIAVVGAGIIGAECGLAVISQARRDAVRSRRPARRARQYRRCSAPDRNGNGTSVAIDTGFIVYNTASYPNLIALFDHLGVPTAETDMSFAVSLDGGSYEYSGGGLASLIGHAVERGAAWRTGG